MSKLLCCIVFLIPGIFVFTSKGESLQRIKPTLGVDCPTDIKNCIEPITSKICSGNGACVCGQCACFQTDFELFYGRFCQHCESCSPNHCETLRPCVECRIHASGDYKSRQECEVNCSRFPQIQIDEVSSSGEKEGNYFCSFRDSENCEFYFMYGYDATGHLVIIAERNKECPVSESVIPEFGGERSEKFREHHRLRKVSRPISPPPLFTSLLHQSASSQSTTSISGPKKSPSISNFPHIILTQNQTHLPPLVDNTDGGSPGSETRERDATKSQPPPRVLNTQAFDLMIVCGLRLGRTSKRTTQYPEYFHRNGIHFDVENCQFVPRSKYFVFHSPENPEEDKEQGRMKDNHEEEFYDYPQTSSSSNANRVTLPFSSSLTSLRLPAFALIIFPWLFLACRGMFIRF